MSLLSPSQPSPATPREASAYLMYGLAETLHASGIIATLLGSMLMGIYSKPHLSSSLAGQWANGLAMTIFEHPAKGGVLLCLSWLLLSGEGLMLATFFVKGRMPSLGQWAMPSRVLFRRLSFQKWNLRKKTPWLEASTFS